MARRSGRAKEDYGREGIYGWEIDYIVPLSDGGTNRFDNLRPIHWMNKAAFLRIFTSQAKKHEKIAAARRFLNNL